MGKLRLVSKKSESVLTQSDGYRLQGKLSLKSQVFHLGGNPWVIKMPFLCQQCLKEIPSSSPTAALSAIYPSCRAGCGGEKAGQRVWETRAVSRRKPEGSSCSHGKHFTCRCWERASLFS